MNGPRGELIGMHRPGLFRKALAHIFALGQHIADHFQRCRQRWCAPGRRRHDGRLAATGRGIGHRWQLCVYGLSRRGQIEPWRRECFFDVVAVAEWAGQESLGLLFLESQMAFEPALKGVAMNTLEIKNLHA